MKKIKDYIPIIAAMLIMLIGMVAFADSTNMKCSISSSHGISAREREISYCEWCGIST